MLLVHTDFYKAAAVLFMALFTTKTSKQEIWWVYCVKTPYGLLLYFTAFIFTQLDMHTIHVRNTIIHKISHRMH